ncbi:MAG: zinc finger domain-containing protein [Candidatus Nanoarchaeia archaeon]|jgi:Zn-ribbon RNA-binding protein|nr:zinc finger domain-containing protein [Candidatus Nanoarchaeia archaeon]
MEKIKHCTSCNVSVVNDQGSTNFLCPNCGKQEIVRCRKCREIVTKYKCPECGFIGPN